MNDDISHLFDHLSIAAHLVAGGYMLGPLEFEGASVAWVLPAARINSQFCTNMFGGSYKS